VWVFLCAHYAKGVYVDDKAVENLQFHQDTVATDSNSPLHLIREKEIEISGRMFAAKRQADETVATARKRAAAIMNSATEDASVLASAHDQEVQARLKTEIDQVRSRADSDIEALGALIDERRAKAVSFVVKSVLGD